MTHVRVEILARRKIDLSLARIFDPQGWSTACGQYFADSYKIHESEGRPQLIGGQPIQQADSPAVGTSWSGFFFEHVRAAAAPFVTWRVQNILRTAFTAEIDTPRPVIRMEFRLHECLTSNLGMSSIPGGIDVDCGYIEVVQERHTPGVIRVVATKSLRFTNRHDLPLLGATIGVSMNQATPVIVGKWMDELVLRSLITPEVS